MRPSIRIRVDLAGITCKGDIVDRTPLIRQGLEEAQMMLADVAGEPEAIGLLERLKRIEQQLETWSAHPPNRLERAALINDVVTLKMDISRVRQMRTSGIIPRGGLVSDRGRYVVNRRSS